MSAVRYVRDRRLRRHGRVWRRFRFVNLWAFIAKIHGFSSQISADEINQLIGRLFIERTRVTFAIDEMRAHMIFDDFSHQSCGGAAYGGDQMDRLVAASLS